MEQEDYREIPVGKNGLVTLVSQEDYEWLSQWYWGIHIGARKPRPYVRRYVSLERGSSRCQAIWMHREILGVKPGERVAIDHINHNTLDNRRSNLRIATISQNGCNMEIPSHNTSGYKGVSFCKVKKKWAAYIQINGKKKSLGYHDTAEKAGEAYKEAAKSLHGEFAHTDSGCMNCVSLKQRNKVLEAALRELRNEISGLLHWREAQLRELGGHTNVAILKDKIARADAVLREDR